MSSGGLGGCKMKRRVATSVHTHLEFHQQKIGRLAETAEKSVHITVDIECQVTNSRNYATRDHQTDRACDLRCKGVDIELKGSQRVLSHLVGRQLPSNHGTHS